MYHKRPFIGIQISGYFDSLGHFLSVKKEFHSFCDSIRRQQQEVKQQKESIKHLERENKQIRDDLQAEYNERNQQIQKLRKIIANLKQNSQSKEQEVNKVNKLKRKLSSLNETKEELLVHINRDKIATPKLDDIQNEIEELKKTYRPNNCI
ncbi:hypothetical protein TVAG_375460 [Trichomonas vaginalis G3]|uniref:Uncharacterized protein n=1 Tax=Trichomonas vaginalis (strain ATCC PRA-98 / G3) TaxID=412133 RepID=A2G5X3_TRIV3|nr:hypothetical protein TVAGG3_0247720 [Trichomonas vaginalis G3]EAX87443.1 hypothetical protein TVAG_375460 [Trichomonas vaginalis G3]KAI5553773.1 hypothetical protein TVAGG3_0247720 [Trichomonas vaginalis G3]|eukprot:XP_001300373.1 hypothetical protein [Trichomonas vaginalis G3]